MKWPIYIKGRFGQISSVYRYSALRELKVVTVYMGKFVKSAVALFLQVKFKG